MTKERAEYFKNKYKVFIKVWQTSDSVNEVHVRLEGEHGWRNNMEAYTRYSKPSQLTIQNVQSYANRLYKKGVSLKDLPYHYERVVPDHHSVDYTELNEYSQQMRRAE